MDLRMDFPEVEKFVHGYFVSRKQKIAFYQFKEKILM